MADERKTMQVLKDVIMLSSLAYKRLGTETEKGLKIRQILDVGIKKCLDISSKEGYNKILFDEMKAKKLKEIKNE